MAWTKRTTGPQPRGRLAIEALEARCLLAIAAPASAVDLATVDFAHRTLADGSEEWFHFTARRSTILTAAADTAALELYSPAGGVLSTLATGTGRLDLAATAGREYFLRVSGAAAGDELTILNLVSPLGTSVTVFGSAGDDIVDLASSPAPRATINGVDYQFAPGTVESIFFDGGAGRDVASLYDSPGDDTLVSSPGDATLTGGGFRLRARAEEINSYGSTGVDVAQLYDSKGNDRFVAKDGGGQLIAASGALTRASAFDEVHAYGTAGGRDEAWLYDTPGDDVFVGRPEWSKLENADSLYRVKAFDAVHAYGGSGGRDRARLYGSRNSDKFSASPFAASITGKGYWNEATGFASVTAYAVAGGYDRAVLTDSAADDLFMVRPTDAEMTDLAGAYYNRAEDFDEVQGYALLGGNDAARFYDSPGDDRFTGRADWSRLDTPAGSFGRANGFDEVHAYAYWGGRDEAWLYGSSSADTFEARPEYSRLAGPGFVNRVGFFEVVHVAAESAADSAEFASASGMHSFRAEGQLLRMSGTEYAGGAYLVEYTAATNSIVSAHLRNAGDTLVIAKGATLDLHVQRPAAATVDAAAFLDPADPTYGLQAAIDSLPAGGGTVLLPAGTFPLRAGLVLRSGVTLRGVPGGLTVLKRAAHVGSDLVISAQPGDSELYLVSTAGFRPGDEVGLFAYDRGNADALTVRIAGVLADRLVLSGPLPSGASLAIEQDAAAVNLFPLVRGPWSYEGQTLERVVVEDLVLEGNRLSGFAQWRLSAPGLLDLVGAADAVVRRTTVRGSFGMNVRLTGGHDNRLEANTIDDAFAHGIYVLEERDLSILGNTVRRSGWAAPKLTKLRDGIVVDGSQDVRVENNLAVANADHGLHPAGNLTRDGIWRNNTSRANGQNGFHFCYNNFAIVVIGNELADNAWHGVGGLGDGGWFGDRFNVISGNSIHDNDRLGIEINGGIDRPVSADNIITGNLIYANSQRQPGKWSGIRVSNAVRTEIEGNTFTLAGAAATQGYSIELVGATDDTLIVGNKLGPGGMLLVGANNVVDGNTTL